ncbi:protein phosphatase, partial [Micromonospora sp. KC723]
VTASPVTPPTGTPVPRVAVSATPGGGGTTPSATAPPTTTPDASASDAVPPAVDPAGCRSPE